MSLPYIFKDARSAFYTRKIGHKSCNMLGILNKLTLQKALQTFLTNNVLLDNKVKTLKQRNKRIKHKNPCQINKAEFAGHTFPTSSFSCNTCMDNYI